MNKVTKGPLVDVPIGYRAKTRKEKNGPDDYVLVPLDAETQREFERTIVSHLVREAADGEKN